MTPFCKAPPLPSRSSLSEAPQVPHSAQAPRSSSGHRLPVPTVRVSYAGCPPGTRARDDYLHNRAWDERWNTGCADFNRHEDQPTPCGTVQGAPFRNPWRDEANNAINFNWCSPYQIKETALRRQSVDVCDFHDSVVLASARSGQGVKVLWNRSGWPRCTNTAAPCCMSACILRTVTRPGPNFGRVFWTCPYSIKDFARGKHAEGRVDTLTQAQIRSECEALPGCKGTFEFRQEFVPGTRTCQPFYDHVKL